jgi:hypothetical protein
MALSRCGRFCCIKVCIRGRYITICVFVIFCFGLVLVVNGIFADGISIMLGRKSVNENCWGTQCHRKAPIDHQTVPTYHRNVPTDHRNVPTNDRNVPTDPRYVLTNDRNVSIDHPHVPTDHGNVPTGAMTHTKLKDVFISVKTGARHHKSRIRVLVETWFQMAKNEVCFILMLADN